MLVSSDEMGTWMNARVPDSSGLDRNRRPGQTFGDQVGDILLLVGRIVLDSIGQIRGFDPSFGARLVVIWVILSLPIIENHVEVFQPLLREKAHSLDQTANAPSREGTAGEADQINFIAVFVIVTQEDTANDQHEPCVALENILCFPYILRDALSQEPADVE